VVLLIVEGRFSLLLTDRVLDMPAGYVGLWRQLTFRAKPAPLDR
jgi:hypothetical protein